MKIDRTAQPPELVLTEGTNGVGGVLTLITVSDGATNNLTPTLTTTESKVPTSDALRKQLDETPTDLPVLLVFAPPTLTYGKLRKFIGPAMTTHPTVHVFLEAVKSGP